MPVKRFDDMMFRDGDLRNVINSTLFIKTPFYKKPKLINKNITAFVLARNRIEKEYFNTFGYSKEYFERLKQETELSEMIIARYETGDRVWNTFIKMKERDLIVKPIGGKKRSIEQEALLIAEGLGLPLFNLNTISVHDYYHARNLYIERLEQQNTLVKNARNSN